MSTKWEIQISKESITHVLGKGLIHFKIIFINGTRFLQIFHLVLDFGSGSSKSSCRNPEPSQGEPPQGEVLWKQR